MVITLGLFMAGCSTENESDTDGLDRTAIEDDIDTSLLLSGGGKKTMRLGSSLFAVQADRRYYAVRVSNEEWADDIVARYHNDITSLDFAVYQFSKEGYPESITEFTQTEAAKYNAYEIVTENHNINGFPVTYYRSIELYNDEELDGITFVLENGDEYIEFDFRFYADTSEDESWEIMRSLSKIDVAPHTIGSYCIDLPTDFVCISGENKDHEIYQSGSGSMVFYINHGMSNGHSLAEYARQSGGSDIETEEEIGGIPVAYYRSVDESEGAYHSFLHCVIQDPNPTNQYDLITLSFRLDGISAEAEAEKILESLTLIDTTTSEQ